MLVLGLLGLELDKFIGGHGQCNGGKSLQLLF